MVTSRSNRRTLDHLAEALRSRSGWTLSFVGEDQPDKLAALVDDLRRGFSDNGDGKRIVSGFSYWGVAPTVAWTKACNDPFYRVMRESIRRFSTSWDSLAHHLADHAYHYVSLGVGTGEKDRDVLSRLAQRNREMFFVPVDMSAAMLRVGVQRATSGVGIDRSRVLPVELDFSRDENVEELRAILDILFGDQPILFSLLGNTLANFDDDNYLLSLLSGLLRRQDRLLLEHAISTSITQAAAQEAAEEYRQSEAFRQFALSALLHNTDLRLDRRHAGTFQGEVEEGRAIRVRVLHRNSSADDQFSLPDGLEVDFQHNDTVRLYLTRKYSKEGSHKLIASSNLSVLGEQDFLLRSGATAAQFGVSLMLLASSVSDLPASVPKVDPQPSAAVTHTAGVTLAVSADAHGASAVTPSVRLGRVFVSYSHRDNRWLERLRVHLRPLEREGRIDFWADTRIALGANWRNEITAAIEAADVAVLLVSADFLASDFVAQSELPPLLAAAEQRGLTVLSVIVSPSQFANTPALARFQTVNSPERPLVNLRAGDRDEVLTKVAEAIRGRLERGGMN